VTAGVEMDVLGLGYSEYNKAEREAVVHAHPRSARFKEDIIQAFYDGNKHKPETTFGNVNADVLADKDSHFTRVNFCSVIAAPRGEGKLAESSHRKFQRRGFRKHSVQQNLPAAAGAACTFRSPPCPKLRSPPCPKRSDSPTQPAHRSQTTPTS